MNKIYVQTKKGASFKNPNEVLDLKQVQDLSDKVAQEITDLKQEIATLKKAILELDDKINRKGEIL